MAMSDILGNKVAERDRKQMDKMEEMLGPDPRRMGVVKNFFWGSVREDLLFPYPETSQEEREACDRLLEKVDAYFTKEHPSVEIDRTERIPKWCMSRLFEMGVMGMTIPKEYGGLGMSVTSYNRILQRIGQSCGSTAVVVSAHQSIGCKALVLFGTTAQKEEWLPKLATNMLSAFCLSEPNVGCDAGGQETTVELTPDGKHFILNGEKKWATSGALCGMMTVMAKQNFKDPKTGAVKEKVTAVIVTPQMAGVDIFSNNRSKCGIRGTWQARIRFTNVKVPVENTLGKQGAGLPVALNCLNYGRCTLSAGMVGGAITAYRQAAKWAETRFQFDRPLADFELVSRNMSLMAAYNYAMDAVLYMTTGIVDRSDEDIMLETALCKVFCSEIGYEVCDRALQIMGGEGYMTEVEVERIWRDSRINRIVEGANEVMHSFIFAYGSKQLGEALMKIKTEWYKPKHWLPGMRVGLEMFCGLRRGVQVVGDLHEKLIQQASTFSTMVRDHSYHVKKSFLRHQEKLIDKQILQERIGLNTMWLYASACVLSKLDQGLKAGKDMSYDLPVANYFLQHAAWEFKRNIRALTENPDMAMRDATKQVRQSVQSWPNKNFIISERSPNAKGTGKVAKTVGDFTKEESTQGASC